MKPPSLSVVLTLNDRDVTVMSRVFGSLREQPFDQLVVVLDRAPQHVVAFVDAYARADERTDVVSIEGPPGWRSPVKAWNAGFGRVMSELTYMLSSETIQGADNIKLAKELLADRPAVLFGKAECDCGPEGKEVTWGDGAPGNLLVDSAHPRPLGFVCAMPTWVLRATGGFDEAFAEGLWYDDDDLFRRVWDVLPLFVFDDRVTGVHQHHERPVLATPEGQAATERNLGVIVRKWGTASPFQLVKAQAEKEEGRTWWLAP